VGGENEAVSFNLALTVRNRGLPLSNQIRIVEYSYPIVLLSGQKMKSRFGFAYCEKSSGTGLPTVLTVGGEREAVSFNCRPRLETVGYVFHNCNLLNGDSGITNLCGLPIIGVLPTTLEFSHGKNCFHVLLSDSYYPCIYIRQKISISDPVVLIFF